ncbi:MAG: efflux RND transporter periplasmic adaptor subunit [Crocinitomicaceae bacterium]|nr:efflux RND transporter periplasmic adaptor subunit [Crocinitomicaceae bacterium]
MNIRLYTSAVLAAVILASCGGSVQSDNELERLKAKRDSLKNELAIINEQIALLDTSKEVLIPIVTASSVEQKDFVHKVEVQGSVETDENVVLTAESQGVIRTIHVREGQKVSQGQALITIDSEILASTIDEIETSLEMANYMLDKQQKLMDEGVGVEIEYEQAKNQKKALEQKLKTMRSQQGKTVIRAPFSGVVDEIMVSLGDMASPMTPTMRIVNNKNITIAASLAENLLANVGLGTPVDLVIPAMNDTAISGVVSYKGNFIDPVNRTFKIQVEIKNNSILMANMLAKVNVVDFTRKNALVVKTESVLQDTKNNNYVFKLKQGEGGLYSLEKVFVTIEKSYRGESCIIPVVAGSLNQGDQIVLSGAKGITESDKVKLQ